MKKILSFFITIVLIFQTSCSNNIQKYTETRFQMGTVVQITLFDKSEKNAQVLMDSAFAEIDRIASLFYEKNPNSQIYKFNNREINKPVKMPEEILNLVARGNHVSDKTYGAFDITIRSILNLYSLKPEKIHIPDSTEIITTLPFVDYTNLIIDHKNKTISSKILESKLAVGGIVKGYAVDKAIEKISKFNNHGILINAGGDLRATPRYDKKKWTIGIQDPRNTDNIIHIIGISEGAVTTSGDYEQFVMRDGKRIHHIIDPRTGFSADLTQSVTMIAPNAELADCLATGIFVLGAENGLKAIKSFPECECYIIDNHGKTFQTDNFQEYIIQ